MATYTVTTAADVVAADGQLSLREAITLANANAGSDTILFSAGLAGSVITLTSGQLVLSDDVTVDGDSNGDNKADITISGNAASRIFDVTGAGTDVDLLSLTISNGMENGNGGAIQTASGTVLNVVHSTIRDSVSNSYSGGGIVSAGTLRIESSTIVGNSALGYGGGISGSGTTTIVNTTISGNTSVAGKGGGVSLTGGFSSIRNSTIIENEANGASGSGGGLVVSIGGTVDIENTVIALNTATSDADAVSQFSGVLRAQNSFFGTNVIIDVDNGNNLNNAGDPLLGALADNGGTVQTRALLSGSGLFNAGDASLLPADVLDIDDDGNVLEVLPLAANGQPRQLGVLDIGAFESNMALVVDTLVDEDDGDFSAGDLSLREALANVADGGTITFAAALAGGTITLGGTQLDIAKDVIIDGDSNGDDKADITISGDATSRIFDISGAATDVDLLSLTLINGNASDGGAIRAVGINTLDVVNSTISNNNSTDDGGGIYLDAAGTTTITNSLISGNMSIFQGGGIYTYGGATLNLINTTVHDNIAGGYGGGLSFYNSIGNIYNSTITGNTANASGLGNGFGGGLDNYFSTLVVTNSVVAGNTTFGVADDIYGNVDISTNSFFGTSETILAYVGGAAATINGGGDALLGALADNGGTVQTRAILNGSQLTGAGQVTALPIDEQDLDNDGDSGEPLPTDANGNARVHHVLDIGAVESRFIVVDNIVDEDDGDFSAGDLSLREAIGFANAGDTIVFDAGLAGQTITLSGTELDITSDLTINGDSNGDYKADITISGNDNSRVFDVGGNSTVNLVSLDLTDGNYSAGDGGAVYGRGGTTINVIASTIRDSTAYFGGGASIFGTMNIVNSTISGNTAEEGGGLYVNLSDTLNVINSTIYGNTATYTGGGIGTTNNSIVGIYNSTIAGNSAGDASGGGGLQARGSAVVTISNSIVANNTANGVADDVDAIIDTANNSFFGTTETITAGAGNNNGSGDPLFGELLDNGGPVLTLSPLDGSPVIGAGSNGVIPPDFADIDLDGNTAEPLPLDGRGGARIVGGIVDIGAVEQFEDETIRGTDGVNNIIGGLGDDFIEGLAGADNIDGGAHGASGDTASFEGSSGAVQVNLDAGTATGGHAAGDVLSNIENLTGSRFGDILTGNGDANFIDGALGNDMLNGLGGNDVLIGGFNHDTLNGGEGDDDLEGKEGNDIIDGGAGVDTGRFDSFGGAVIINLNLTAAQNTGAGGTDTITNIENLIGGIGNDRFTGKVQVSVLEGGGGSDSLFGLGGDDILRGGEGNDNAQGGNGLDTLIGGNGRDTLVGGAGIDTINGDAGKDVIRGGDDGDIIDGGADRDVLIGGDFTGGGFPGDGAADTFIFSEVAHSAFGGATRDIIRDFEQGLDIIDLSAIDAITGGGDNAFTFIGTSGFNGVAGELRAFSVGGNTSVRADVDGDGAADFEVFLNGAIVMTAGDFVL